MPSQDADLHVLHHRLKEAKTDEEWEVINQKITEELSVSLHLLVWQGLSLGVVCTL